MAVLVFLFDNTIFPVIYAFETPTPKQALARRGGVGSCLSQILFPDLHGSRKFLSDGPLIPNRALGSCLQVPPAGGQPAPGKARGGWARQAAGHRQTSLPVPPGCVWPQQVSEPIISGS